jgi:putative protease
LAAIAPDAFIVADPGILAAARRIAPHIPIHLSTQANTTNAAAAAFWEAAGIRRINTARELTLEEIKAVAETTALEVEAFVHGAMCISYSGRCLLSSFMARRHSNQGACAHPCRWQYAVVEAKRPGEYMPITEDQRGTYIFNSKDLCMIAHLPEMIAAGVTSFKIEGRMKGIHYLASVVKVYREALDRCYAEPGNYRVEEAWIRELGQVSHRQYSTGFYFNDPDQTIPNFEQTRSFHHADHRFIAKITAPAKNGKTPVEVRNKILQGEPVSVLPAAGPARPDTLAAIWDDQGNEVAFAQPGARVWVSLSNTYERHDLIRRESRL